MLEMGRYWSRFPVGTALEKVGKGIFLMDLGLFFYFHQSGNDALVNELSEADVGDAGGVVSHQVDVRIEDQRVDGLGVFAQYCKNDNNKNNKKQQMRSVRFANNRTIFFSFLFTASVVEKELVKLHAFDEVAQRLRLERRQVRVAHFP